METIIDKALAILEGFEDIKNALLDEREKQKEFCKGYLIGRCFKNERVTHRFFYNAMDVSSFSGTCDVSYTVIELSPARLSSHRKGDAAILTETEEFDEFMRTIEDCEEIPFEDFMEARREAFELISENVISRKSYEAKTRLKQ